jgi:hypothetical protein
MLILARDLDGLDLGLLAHGLGDGDREHAVLQSGLHLVHLGVLRQPEPLLELAAAVLHAVPPTGRPCPPRGRVLQN